MNDIVRELISRGEHVSVMESCTGGYIANMITNVEGSSEVFSFGAVTYSNEYKVKLGVSSEVILKYSVYSMETAHEMSLAIAHYTKSRYGIGITGKLNCVDKNNLFGSDHLVYVSIIDAKKNIYVDRVVVIPKVKREEAKDFVLNSVIELFHQILKMAD